MRNPTRSRNTALIVGLLGAATVTVLVTSPQLKTGDAILGIGVTIGLSCAIFGLTGALFYHVSTLEFARLKRGEGIIWRGKFSGDQWRDFVSANESRAAANPDYPNDIDIRETPTEPEPEVIVTRTALMVDGDFHVYGDGSAAIVQTIRLYGSPPSLEINMLMSGGGESTTTKYYCLRFPVENVSAAELIGAHLDTVGARLAVPPGLALRNPRKTLIISAIVAVVSAVAFAVGMFFRPLHQYPVVALSTAISGALLCLGALVLMAIVLIHTRVRNREGDE